MDIAVSVVFLGCLSALIAILVGGIIVKINEACYARKKFKAIQNAGRSQLVSVVDGPVCSCGRINQGLAKYCAKCGVEMESAEEDAQGGQ